MLLDRIFFGLFGLAFMAVVVEGLQSNNTLNSTGVFSNLNLGVTMDNEGRDASSYDADMRLAKFSGIDAFALNIGTDPSMDKQLGLAYASAAQIGMKVFISFDFAWFRTDDPGAIAARISRWAKEPAQFFYNGKIFVSSFEGNGLDVNAVRAQVRQATGMEIYFAPNFAPRGQGGAGFGGVDGALNWMGWRNNGHNRAPDGAVVTVDAGDRAYINELSGKGYIAPVSAWFSTHFGPEVAYSKNWVFPGDLLLYHRWVEILALQPQFVELLTWNDYGESHYMGPLSSRHSDDGASKWVNDMPHTGWLTLSKAFITAYKAGANTLWPYFIDSDKLIYWYRTHPRDLNCDSTDTTGRPEGYQILTDTISVVVLLRSPAVVSILSGGTRYLSSELPAGASALSVPFKLGAQRFSIMRNGVEVMEATSLKEIKAECPCGLYNFNPYVGTLAPEAVDSLDSAGLAAFSRGLRADCKPQPSLSPNPPPTAPVTSTVGVGPVPTEKV
ncbi:hypothetical protein V5O48_004321 [Marasmius crinis-equi]|uniref:Uncharacterized protein n=1 Tax=Marasmius crinis-equi TaxID=585013 RepID=A0ABR3FQY6_9AGAR